MFRYFLIITLFVFMFVPSITAQTIDKNESESNDSTKFILQNLLNPQSILDSLSSLRVPKLKYKNDYHNLEQDIVKSRYNYLQIENQDSSIYNKFSAFKKNLASYLKLKYGELPNYDLGIVGRYLLTAKKITAIILLILSL